MKCNCIEELPKKYLEHEKVNNKYSKAELIDVVLSFDTGKFQTKSTIEATLIKSRGRKKIDKINIVHSYCPFCGKATEFNKKHLHNS
jgi:hypothetical protein